MSHEPKLDEGVIAAWDEVTTACAAAGAGIDANGGQEGSGAGMHRGATGGGAESEDKITRAFWPVPLGTVGGRSNDPCVYDHSAVMRLDMTTPCFLLLLLMSMSYKTPIS